MLRAASIGIGWWSDELAKAIHGRSDRIEIVACASRDRGKAAKFAERFQARVLDGYEATLRDPEIDAVLLTTPHSLHAEHVIAAARAGKHVFVEKPFTLTRESAVEAAAACRDAGVVLAVGHNRRFSAAAQELLRLMKNRAFGTLLHIEANFSAPGALAYTPDKWRASRKESPGGGLAGLGVHMIDLVAWLGGPIRGVMAQAKHRAVSVDIDDTTSALFDLASGATAYLGCCFACPNTNFLNIYGTDLNAFARVDANALELQERQRTPTAVPLEPVDTLKAELEEFAAACAGERAFRVTPEEAIHVVDVMQAIVSSAAKGGHPVRLDTSATGAERTWGAGRIAGQT